MKMSAGVQGSVQTASVQTLTEDLGTYYPEPGIFLLNPLRKDQKFLKTNSNLQIPGVFATRVSSCRLTVCRVVMSTNATRTLSFVSTGGAGTPREHTSASASRGK